MRWVVVCTQAYKAARSYELHKCSHEASKCTPASCIRDAIGRCVVHCYSAASHAATDWVDTSLHGRCLSLCVYVFEHVVCVCVCACVCVCIGEVNDDRWWVATQDSNLRTHLEQVHTHTYTHAHVQQQHKLPS